MNKCIDRLRMTDAAFINISEIPNASIAKPWKMPVSSLRYWQLGISVALRMGSAIALTGCFAITLSNPRVLAQIIPDTTLGAEGSVVKPNSQVRELPAELIEGGATRGTNLFHSFQEFNVGNGQRVYFANPTGIENILTRVTGNNLSNILGTLGVDGGANLFLLNPNGIIFGANAKLDIAGSFVASTADNVVFNNGYQFSAKNPEAPPLLTISLTPGLQYGTNQPRATITNSGNLTVGQNLTLSAGNLDLQGQLQAGGDLTLFAQDIVKVRDSVPNPFIASSGGQLLIQGNHIDIFALNHPNSGLFSVGDMVLRSANTIGGDTHYWSGGSFRIEQLDKSLGDLSSPHDPIILANGDVSLGDYAGASLHILAGGSVTLGNVEITVTDSENNTINPNNPDPFLASLATVPLSDGTTLTIDGSTKPTLDVRAGIDWTTFPGGAPGNRTIGTVAPTPAFSGATRADITVTGNIRVSEADGVVLLTNQYRPNGLPGNISTQDIDTGRLNFDPFSSLPGNGGSITIDSQGNITTSTLDSESVEGNGGAIALTASGNITTDTVDSGSSEGNGGAIAFRADGDISVNSSDLSTTFITSGSREGNGGAIALTAGGNISTETSINSSSDSGDGGAITLTADGDITAGNLSSSSLSASSFLSVYPPSGNGGALILTAGGNITTNNLYSFSHSFNSSSDNGGAIALTAGGNITTGTLSSYSYSHSSSGNGGAIALTAGDNITTDNLDSSSGSDSLSSSSGKGGAIALTAIDGRIQIINGYASVFPQINASGLGGGDITLKSPAERFEMEAGLISSNAFNGNGGNIQIEAASVAFTDTNLTTTAAGIGNAGSISITANDLVSLDQSRLFTSLERGGIGRGGDIRIDAGAVSLTNASFIDTATFSLGDAGNVKIEVDDSILLDTNSAIFSITAGIGNGGNVALKAGDAVELDNASNISTAVNPGAQGNGGNIAIEARSLSLTGGSQLVTNTSSSGKAGDITVNAAEGVLITGVDPNFTPPQPMNVSVANPPALNEVEPNDSIAQAQPLTQFFLNSLDDVHPNVEFSTRIPYVSISGKGATRLFFPDANYYSFEVETAGTRAIFDIDRGGNFTSGLYLLDSTGNRLASNFGASPSLGAGGSRINEDPYIRYAFSKPGTYFIQFTTGALGAYTLQVSLDTPNLATSVDNGVLASGLFARSESAGVAGKVTINTPQLTVLNGGNISATATAAATSTARGGSIAVNSSQVNLSGNTSGLFALTQGVAPAGSLTLQPYNNGQTLTVNLQEGAQISASTSGAGKGGTLTVTAPESVTISGNGTLEATADASSTGIAGDVLLSTPQLTVTNGARVSASTNSINASATGGNLTIQAEQLNLTGKSTIDAGTTGAAPGGNLLIQPLGESQTLSVNFQDGSIASASSSGSGKGGTLTVTAPESITISGNGSFISAETSGSGAGGDLNLNTGNLTVRDGAKVTVSSTGTGDAGNLNVNANFVLLENGQLIAETASGEGGNINLNVEDLVLMRNNSLISAQAGNNGNGGNITINNSGFIVAVPREDSDIVADADRGNGGNINIRTQGIFGLRFRPQRTPESDITASSKFGLSGSVTINQLNVDPSRGLAELPVDVVDASNQIDRRCTPDAAKQHGSFTITGRGGLPPSPNDTLQAESLITNWVTLDSQQEKNRSPASTIPNRSAPKPLTEAQGWMINEKGEVVLTAAASKVTPQGEWLPTPECNPPQTVTLPQP